MYGGNFIARLNMPLGLTPYLNIGAGYLDASKRYVGSGNGVDPKSGLFLFGGAGLEIPLHRYVALHGNINAMLTQQGNPDITNVTSPQQVKVSTFYQAGLRINLGRSAQSGRALYEDYSAGNVSTAVALANEANLRELNELRASYESRINKLNKELAEAVSRRDTVTVTRVLREKEDLSGRISSVDKSTSELAVAQAQEVAAPAAIAAAIAPSATATTTGARTVTLTTSQFEQLVRRVISEVNKENKEKSTTLGVSEVTNSNLSDLDKILLLNALYQGQYRMHGLNLQPLQAYPQVAPVQQAQPQQEYDNKAVDANIALIKRLDQVIDRLDAISTSQAKTASATNTAVNQMTTQALAASVAKDNDHHIIIADRDDRGQVYAQEVRVRQESPIRFQGFSLFAGPNFGDAFALNIGGRAHLQIRDTRFDLVPDLYIGLGEGSHFGLNANLRYNLPTLLDGALNPYIGAGLGYNKVGGTGRFLPNYVVGTTLNKVLGGGLYIDYTVRGAFRNNQLAVGYRFHF